MNEEKKLNKLNLITDEEYLFIVNEILNHKEFIKRKEYHHHENRSVYTHSLMVSLYSYKIAKFMHLNYHDAAVGGLLHDFYYNDWQLTKRKGITNMHGIKHAKEALENSKKIFSDYINDRTADIIEKHMFPLNIRPPKYLEGWIITLVDKTVSLEILLTPKQLYKYVGLAFIYKFFKIKIR